MWPVVTTTRGMMVRGGGEAEMMEGILAGGELKWQDLVRAGGKQQRQQGFSGVCSERG